MDYQTELPPPTLVTEPHQLMLLIAQLVQQPMIAVDTESNSLHAYQEQVCLLQFSLPGADFLVDPLAGLDLSALGKVFASPQVEKVFHAAEYDVMCLRRDFDWKFVNLFDTMYAARILGWPRVGLGKILKEQFGVQLNKRWQRYNWGERPLASDALSYARLDTHYLLPLREIILTELKQKKRLQEAQSVFVQIANSEPNFKPFDADRDLWRIKGIWRLEPGEQAIVRELLVWRNKQAKKRNRPPFRVLGDHTLLDIAQSRAKSLDVLTDITGLKEHHVHRYGHKLLRAIKRGSQAEPPKLPEQPHRPDPIIVERYEALRSWRKTKGETRGVDPDVIVSNAALWKIARLAPTCLVSLADLDVLDPWKQQAYGKALLEVLRQMPE